ncbi:MAG TPA: heterodisulfide reductase-related iron-sulfur binding cluster [Fimbriimonadaceae bacterium]|nr:heterodisulfide reductase-related iron-sulfur binding cluster [Fimbriimonadaceae bacterium]
MEPTRSEFLFMPGPYWRLAFYTVTFLCLGYATWVFVQRSKQWMKGKPVTWKSDWVCNVARYIVGQKKVQGSRPTSGAPMHLSLFWGFLSLFLATTLLAAATYAPVIGIPNFHKGLYYKIFETTFDVTGLFFVLGVAWAIVRRWEAVKSGTPPISHTRSDWWTLGVLLMLGLTGYLLEAARIASNPQPWDVSSPVGYLLARPISGLSPDGYIAVWWFHVLWVWAFFISIPHMRMRHIVTATLTAAGKPETPMGRLEPITMEQVERTGKIGVDVAGEFSRWHLLALDACMSCGRCTEVCPANGVGKSLNPKEVVAAIHQTVSTGENVPAAVTEEALWACTTCHACVEACPVLIPHVGLIVDARRNLVAEGKLSGTGAVMLRQVASTGHAWGQPQTGREDWMKGLEVPLCRDGKPFEFLFWVGCAGATDPMAVKTTRAVAQLLKKAGVSFACLGNEEACTGDPARRVGDEFLFQEQVGKNQSVFEKYGVTKVVTACPHCMNTLRNEYPDFMQRAEVYHHTELLNQLVQEERLKAADPGDKETTYHDPCYLARVNGASDAPRGIVGDQTHMDTDNAAILHALERESDGRRRLAEPEHHGRKTLCCGAGGGRMWMEEDPSQRPSSRRAKELLATGAKQVAVACPFCRIMLDAGLKQETDEEIRLVDLAEMLQEANQ